MLTIELDKTTNFKCALPFVIQGTIAGQWVDTIYQFATLERAKYIGQDLLNRPNIGKLRIVRNCAGQIG